MQRLKIKKYFDLEILAICTAKFSIDCELEKKKKTDFIGPSKQTVANVANV